LNAIGLEDFNLKLGLRNVAEMISKHEVTASQAWADRAPAILKFSTGMVLNGLNPEPVQFL
jgi:hypothetical protein